MPEDEQPDAAPPDDAAPALPWQPSGLDLARAVAGEVAARDSRARRPRRDRSGDVPGGRRRTETGEGFSGPAPDERDPQGLANAVERLVAERGWRKELDVAAAVARWPVVVGAQLAEHTTADRFEDGVLWVRADSTSWATQVRMMAPAIVAKLARELGDDVVTRISVEGPSGPSWRHGGRRVRGRGPRDTYG